jgi:hypothetical protein
MASSDYNTLRACAMLRDASFTTPSSVLLRLQGRYRCCSADELFSHITAGILLVLTSMYTVFKDIVFNFERVHPVVFY